MAKLKKLKIAVIGATGYTGLDLIYFLSNHPKVKIDFLCATKNLGKPINFFDKRLKKNLPKLTSIKNIVWENLDLIFLSLPNGEAQKIIKKTFFKYKKLKYIDLSADFRINDPKTYFKNYNIKHKAKNLINESLYSISEFNKLKIKEYRIIANPGCYPTSIQIPLVPLIINKMINLSDIIIDSKSGYSGAGKKINKRFSHKNLYNSAYAYGIKHHRHVCEIDQELSKISNQKIKYTFNPCLLPTFRGILTSIYVKPKKRINVSNIKKFLTKYYKSCKFIKVLKENSEIGSGNVLNTNNCEISVCNSRYKNKIIIFSAIDNLVKGASGQAIQNMNLLYRFPEHLGLDV